MSESWENLLDMDASAAVRPPPLPKGTYRAYIEAYELVKSQRKGTPGVEYKFTKFDPQADVDAEQMADYETHPATDGGISGYVRTETFWLSTKAMWRLKDFCVLAGVVADGSMKKAATDAVGHTILIEIDHSVATDGETVYAEVKKFATDA